jgi:uncharacterized protein (UPF0332 family)
MKPEERNKLKRKEIQGRLALAREYLKIGKILFKENRLRGAIDTTHNAAELAAKGLILLKLDDVPSRHRSIVQKFSELYVKDGPLKREFGRQLNVSLDYRNLARYEPTAKITKKMHESVSFIAEELISFLEKELKKQK